MKAWIFGLVDTGHIPAVFKNKTLFWIHLFKKKKKKYKTVLV